MATKKATSRALGKTTAKKTAPKEQAKKAAPKGNDKRAADVKTDTPKTTLQRVRKLREERTRLGLKRLELYVHPDDWEQLKELAAGLQALRAGASGKKP
jgi:hypothetical protein